MRHGLAGSGTRVVASRVYSGSVPHEPLSGFPSWTVPPRPWPRLVYGTERPTETRGEETGGTPSTVGETGRGRTPVFRSRVLTLPILLCRAAGL